MSWALWILAICSVDPCSKLFCLLYLCSEESSLIRSGSQDAFWQMRSGDHLPIFLRHMSIGKSRVTPESFDISFVNIEFVDTRLANPVTLCDSMACKPNSVREGKSSVGTFPEPIFPYFFSEYSWCFYSILYSIP